MNTLVEFEAALDEVHQQLHDILLEPVNKNDNRALKMAKQAYQSCKKHGKQKS